MSTPSSLGLGSSLSAAPTFPAPPLLPVRRLAGRPPPPSKSPGSLGAAPAPPVPSGLGRPDLPETRLLAPLATRHPVRLVRCIHALGSRSFGAQCGRCAASSSQLPGTPCGECFLPALKLHRPLGAQSSNSSLHFQPDLLCSALICSFNALICSSNAPISSIRSFFFNFFYGLALAYLLQHELEC